MTKPVAIRRIALQLLVLCPALLLLGGCDLLTISQSGRSIREGNDAVSRGEFQKAVQHYEAALDGTMLSAEAHYRLGLVYEDKLKNEVAALHHFERYLELAPQGQFATEVKGYVDRLRLLIVSRLAEGNVVPAREAARLKNENLELRQQLTGLQDQQSKAKTGALRAVSPAKPAVPTTPVVTSSAPAASPTIPYALTEPEVRRAEPAAAAKSNAVPVARAVPVAPASAATPAAPRSHTVAGGDTLAGIAKKYYGKSGEWPKIAEANKDVLPDPTKLKIGTVLKIP
ncbi:MAG: LysM peptidoglycan-binding domain-containing protein [Chthoniobacterales bacterium]